MDKIKFKSLKNAKKYIKDNLPGGIYTICLKDDYAIIDESLARERRLQAELNNEISSKVPYLRINGEFD